MESPGSPATPFTVALHSPSKSQSGILELVPDISSRNGGSQQYIGYFKPILCKDSPSLECDDHANPTATNSKPSITLDTHTSIKTKEADKIDACSKKDQASISNKRCSLKRCRSTSVTATRKTDSKLISKKNEEHKKVSKRPRPRESSSTTRNSRAVSRLDRAKATSSILKRIQHHNQSPERPESLSKLCKTRSQSHITTTSTNVSTPADSKSPLVTSPRQSRSVRTMKRTNRLSQTQQLLMSSADSPNIPSPQSTPEKGVPPTLPNKSPRILSKCKSTISESNTEDSGISSDDQGSTKATTSACKWRYVTLSLLQSVFHYQLVTVYTCQYK